MGFSSPPDAKSSFPSACDCFLQEVEGFLLALVFAHAEVYEVCIVHVNNAN